MTTVKFTYVNIIKAMTDTKNEYLRLRAARLRVNKTEIAQGVEKSRQWVTDYLNGKADSSVLGDKIEEFLDQLEKVAA